MLPQSVEVGDRWQITLPDDICSRMGIRRGDVFTVLQVGDTVVLTHKKLVVPEIAKRVARMLEEQGVTLDDLLEDLEVQRQRYNEEKYGLKDQSVS